MRSMAEALAQLSDEAMQQAASALEQASIRLTEWRRGEEEAQP
jgi:hypothetical protein